MLFNGKKTEKKITLICHRHFIHITLSTIEISVLTLPLLNLSSIVKSYYGNMSSTSSIVKSYYINICHRHFINPLTISLNKLFHPPSHYYTNHQSITLICHRHFIHLPTITLIKKLIHRHFIYPLIITLIYKTFHTHFIHVTSTHENREL